MEKEKLTISFQGPAGWTFGSFAEMAEYYMATFCVGWRDYGNPISHLLPRTFQYDRPEVSDEDSKRLKIERHGDIAEHIVYRAISKCISEGIAAPFIAIHNLKIDDKRQKILKLVFPLVNWGKNREYDFLLIGPKIGLISLEVKGGEFNNQQKDFVDNNFSLPEEYSKGLKQSQSITELVGILEKCIEVKFPMLSIRNVIFTPNLEQKKFEDWRKKLSEKYQQIVDTKIGEAVQLFKEDMVSVGEDMPSLYESIKQILDTDISMAKMRLTLPDHTVPLSTRHAELNVEIYEEFAKALTAISTLITIDKRGNENWVNNLVLEDQPIDWFMNMVEGMSSVPRDPRFGRVVQLSGALPGKVYNFIGDQTSAEQLPDHMQDMSVAMNKLPQREKTRHGKVPPLNDSIGTADCEKEIQICLEEDDFYQMMNIVTASEQLQAQNTKKAGKPLKMESGLKTVEAMKLQLKKLSVMFLTPDQQAILQGGPHQIIFGASGTGKTILLQVKALNYLAKEESAIAITPACLRIHYKSVFEKSGSKNYQIWEWNIFLQHVLARQSINRLVEWGKEIVNSALAGNISTISNPLYHAIVENISVKHVFFEEASNTVFANDGLGIRFWHCWSWQNVKTPLAQSGLHWIHTNLRTTTKPEP